MPLAALSPGMTETDAGTSGGAASPQDDVRVDVVQYPGGAVKAVPAGKGGDVARSQQKRTPRTLLRDRVVLAAAGLAVVGAGGLSLFVLAYSLLVVRALLLGLVAVMLLWGVAVAGTAAVAGVRWFQVGGGELLDEGVPLRDAREQWEATPVSAVATGSDGAAGGAGRPEREHAAEGTTP
jgi:hypothetical protein